MPVEADVPPEIAAVLGCAVLAALAHRDFRVIAVDTLPAKPAAATAAGSHEAMTPGEAVQRGVKGDIVIEAAGKIRALETAVELTAQGGERSLSGCPRRMRV